MVLCPYCGRLFALKPLTGFLIKTLKCEHCGEPVCDYTEAMYTAVLLQTKIGALEPLANALMQRLASNNITLPDDLYHQLRTALTTCAQINNLEN